MRETAKTLMQMAVVGEKNQKNLEAFGIPKEDQNYQTAVVVRLLQKALVEGDTSSTRLLAELTGDLNRFGFLNDDDEDLAKIEFPTINLPDNGRDRKMLMNWHRRPALRQCSWHPQQILLYTAVLPEEARHSCFWKLYGIKM